MIFYIFKLCKITYICKCIYVMWTTISHKSGGIFEGTWGWSTLKGVSIGGDNWI